MFNIIVIDLTKLNSVDEVKQLIDDNNLDKTDADKVFEHKKRGYKKIFFDKATQSAMAYTSVNSKGAVVIQDNFQEFLKNLKPIEPAMDIKDLSIDSILDKINESGFKSLSKREKEFLDNSSK